MGANVIKVEPPLVGDEARQYGPFPSDVPHPERSGLYLYLNTSKLGVTLDMETPTGRDLLRRLLAQADVLVTNYRPRDMERLGLDYGALRDGFPRLVYTWITPFGLSGPYRNLQAYDINMCGAGGVSIGVGEPDREPLSLPLSQAEYQAGVNAVGATIVALLAREATEEGQLVEISGEEIMATLFAGLPVAAYVYRGVTGLRQGHRGGYGLYPRTCLSCKDGYVGITTPQIGQWIRFVEVMGTPEWSKDPRYRNRRAMTEEYPDEADKLLMEWLGQHTKQDVFDLCRTARVPCAPVMDAADLAHSPHLKARGYFVEVDHPAAGRLPYPGAPYKFSDIPWAVRRPAPLLGQHNEEVYCGRLGLSKEDLVRLRNGGVV